MVRIEQLYDLFIECQNVSTDSRNITSFSEKGNKVIFFALKGDNFDGNKFVKKALSDGATYCVADDPIFNGEPGVVVVEDVLTSLQALASYHRKHLSATLFAITGSNGKTTTKELLNAVLSTTLRTCATVGNLNNHIGVPLTLLAIPYDCEIAIIEMGANHHGEIDHLCRIASPDCGLITNIGKAHLDGFGSQHGVAKAKGEMFRFLAESGGKVFYDSSCKWLSSVVDGLEGAELHSYSTQKITTQERESGELTVEINSIVYKTNLIGDYNKYNAAAAVAVGEYFGVDILLIKSAIEGYTPRNKRSQLVVTDRNRVILDAYNANPSSMISALVNFDKLTSCNKIVVLGDMKELGIHTQQEHIEVLKIVQGMTLNRVMLVGGYFRKAMEQYYVMADWYESVDFLLRSMEEIPISDSTILIKGSNSMKLDKVVELL